MAVLGVSSWIADTLADGHPAGAATTDTDNYSDANHVYESARQLGGASVVKIPSTASIWAGAKHYTNLTSNINDAATGDVFSFIDGNGNVVATVSSITTEVFRLMVRVSGVLTQVAVTSTAYSWSYTPGRLDVHIDVGATGTFDLYVNGASVLSWSGDLTDGGSYGAIEEVRFLALWSQGGTQDKCFYWCLVSDDDSRAYVCEQIIPNGAGTHADFTGAYTDIDDVRTATPYADILSSATVGHKFSAAAVNPLAAYATGYDVVGVQVTNRARAGNGNPRIKPLIRHGGVDATGDAALLNGTDSAAKHLFTVNPSTGVAFTYAELASIEIGCEVAAAV